jgi:hypothetical protein
LVPNVSDSSRLGPSVIVHQLFWSNFLQNDAVSLHVQFIKENTSKKLMKGLGLEPWKTC